MCSANISSYVVNDYVDQNVQDAMREYVEKNHRKTTTKNHFGLRYGNDIFKSEKEKLQNFKPGLGLVENVPDGTPMHFYLCKEREERQ